MMSPPQPPSHLSPDVFGATDVGKVRRINQDQFLVASLHKLMRIHQTSLPDVEQDRMAGDHQGLLAVVADGVGGQLAGEHASQTAVESIAQYVIQAMRCYYALDPSEEDDFVEQLLRGIELANDAVLDAARSDPERSGMATTLTLAKILGNRAYVAQVGDSRAYLVHQGALSQITRDQTLAQDLVDQGVMSVHTAEHSPYSHVLSSAIGGRALPVVSCLDLQQGDTLLLCTDGLTKHVTDDEILAIIKQATDARACCRELVSLALDRGGSDNVTAVVCRFTQHGPGS